MIKKKMSLEKRLLPREPAGAHWRAGWARQVANDNKTGQTKKSAFREGEMSHMLKSCFFENLHYSVLYQPIDSRQ